MTARHLGLPWRLDGRGRTAQVDEEAHLRALVENVLFTRPGERVNRPDFGSGIRALVFGTAGDELAGTTRALIQGDLQRWLGELLRVEDVTVEADDSTVTVTIAYTPLATAASAGPPRLMTVRGTL